MPTVSGRDAYFDVPLANLALKAFAGAEGYVGTKLFPTVPVDKQSAAYYILDKNSWIQVPNTFRAPKDRPRRIEWKVSSEKYFADNYALAGENAKEDLANADAALRLRENTTQNVVEGLLRDLEVRIANLVTSVSNLGSGVVLSGANKWSDYVSSDPIADVTTGHAFIRQRTGLVANAAVMDEDTFQVVRRHPVLLDMFKYTQGGLLNEEQLRSVFRVENLWLAQGIKNTALENATATIANIWGNVFVLARVEGGTGLQVRTFGLAFRWQPEGIPAPMQVVRYDDPDPGKKVEVVEAGYYQDEVVVARDLSYGITTTL